MGVQEGLRGGGRPVEDLGGAVGGWAGGAAAVVDVWVENPEVEAGVGRRVGVEDEFAGGEGFDGEEELCVDEDGGVVG